MTTPIHLGTVRDREMFVLQVPDVSAIPADLDLGGGKFTCLIAWDVDRSAVSEFDQAGNRLLDAGCVSVCAWGDDCTWVDDMVDWIDLERNDFKVGDDFVPTDWFPDEPFDEALWYLLFCANPTDGHFAEWRARLIILVGDHRDRLERVRFATASPWAFSEEVSPTDDGAVS